MKQGKVYIPDNSLINLSDREQEILKTIVHLYILNAAPVGSRSLSKYLEGILKLSPATIRNIMSDLEELELISHPHTSAGRVPTDKGYRFYVDSLMDIENLSDREVFKLNSIINTENDEDILKNASRVLGLVSRYLAVVEFPELRELTIHKIELIPLQYNRILVVLALESNYVNTVTLETEFDLGESKLQDIVAYINHNISGKSLTWVRENFAPMMRGFRGSDTPIVRLFLNSFDKIFNMPGQPEKLHISGTPGLLDSPEFEDRDKVKGIIELVENEDVIIHLLDKYEEGQGPRVLIGSEIDDEMLEDYALILSSYNLGPANGCIGLIGPKRMRYSKMISLVQQVSNILSVRK